MSAHDEITIDAILLPAHCHDTGFMLRKYDPIERKNYYGEVVWKEHARNAEVPWAFFIPEFNSTSLGRLMDDLWRMGVRPSGEFHGTAGQLAIAQAHLADLRKIAFHALRITSPS